MAIRPETLPRDPDRLIELVLAGEGKIGSFLQWNPGPPEKVPSPNP